MCGMRAALAIPMSIALLLLSAIWWRPLALEAVNRVGEVTYYTLVAGLPLPYLRTFLTGPGGSPEYTEVLTAQLAADELFWLALSWALLRLVGRHRA